MTNNEIKIDIDEKQAIEINKLYVENLKSVLKSIDEFETKKGDKKDRLDYAFLIGELLALLVQSAKGWQKWCTIYNVQSLFTLEELQKIYPTLKAVIKDFITLDIEVTSSKTQEVEKEVLEGKNQSKKKPIYLS